MKRETKIRAMERLIGMRAARAVAEEAVGTATAACSSTLESDAVAAATAAWRANQAADAADAAWRSLAKGQRDFAAKAVEAAVAMGDAAVSLGGSYSGTTGRDVVWGAETAAKTVVCDGDRYSRRCTYRKKDARHEVTISVDGMVDLVDSPELVAASRDEGLPLISYRAATGEAAWVVVKNKRLAVEHGWIATAGGVSDFVLYHSTESIDHAVRGASRKAGEAARAAERERKGALADRRARLVIRLCRGVTATVADALAAGYCPAGIRAWQERNGIGDEAPLADLVRTGDPLATRLAFDLARKVRREAATA